jgi:hypothetical protein
MEKTKVPPDLTRARELVRLIQQEVARLQAIPSACDPAVPSLATYIDELTRLIDNLPPSSDVTASVEVARELKWISQRVLADATWWVFKKLLESGSDD